MQEVVVKHVSTFRDGGTRCYQSIAGNTEYFVDRAILTKTPGAIYTDYPSRPGATRLFDITLKLSNGEIVAQEAEINGLHNQKLSSYKTSNMKLFKLGTIVTDKAAQIQGMLVNAIIEMDGRAEYIFQPKALNPETGQPVDVYWISPARVVNGIEEEVDVPMNLMGTQAEDKGTGFKGMIIQLVYHINGCIHASIKPSGINKEGNTIQNKDFDLRRLIGEAIPQMTEKEQRESQKTKPSPSGVDLNKRH